MKNVLFSLFASISILQAHSQFQFGLLAGPHNSGLNSLPDLGLNSQSAFMFHGGVIMETPINGTFFCVIAEGLYTSSGFRNSDILAVDKNGNDMGLIKKERINYAQFPLYFAYRGQAPHLKFRIGIGPQLNLKINEITKLSTRAENFRGTVMPAGTQGAETAVFSAGFLGSIQIKKVLIGLNYEHSFSNIFKDQHRSVWRINNLGISLGFFLK